MHFIGIASYSGARKTSLLQQLVPQLRGRSHRAAGAFKVVAASPQWLALLREFVQPCEPPVPHLLAELYGGVDCVLAEGFRDADWPALEVLRAATGNALRYPHDDFVAAIATDAPPGLPAPTGLPVRDLNNPQAQADWLLSQSARLAHNPELSL